MLRDRSIPAGGSRAPRSGTTAESTGMMGMRGPAQGEGLRVSVARTRAVATGGG